MKQLLAVLLFIAIFFPDLTWATVKHPLIEAHELLQAKEIDKAQQILASFIPDVTVKETYDYLLALVYLEKKQYDEAYVLLKRVRPRLSGENGPTIALLRVLRLQQRYDEALQLLDESRQQMENDPNLTDEELALFVTLGLYHEALKVIKRHPRPSPALTELQIQLHLAVADPLAAFSLTQECYFKSNFSLPSSRMLAQTYASYGLFSSAAAIEEIRFLTGKNELSTNISYYWQKAGALKQSQFFEFLTSNYGKKN